jgi:hypothetical protein
LPSYTPRHWVARVLRGAIPRTHYCGPLRGLTWDCYLETKLAGWCPCLYSPWTDPKENTASDPLLLHDVITGTGPKENASTVAWLSIVARLSVAIATVVNTCHIAYSMHVTLCSILAEFQCSFTFELLMFIACGHLLKCYFNMCYSRLIICVKKAIHKIIVNIKRVNKVPQLSCMHLYNPGERVWFQCGWYIQYWSH